MTPQLRGMPIEISPQYIPYGKTGGAGEKSRRVCFILFSRFDRNEYIVLRYFGGISSYGRGPLLLECGRPTAEMMSRQ